MSGGWLLDPVTREPLPAYPNREPEIAYNAGHWRPGWRSGFEYENGVPARLWYRQCQDECCAEYRANLPPLESLR